MPKTPDLPPGMTEGFYGEVNDKGEITLYMISKRKAVWKGVQNTTNIEQTIFTLLSLSNISQQRTRAPDIPILETEAPLRTLPVSTVALAPNQLQQRLHRRVILSDFAVLIDLHSHDLPSHRLRMTAPIS